MDNDIPWCDSSLATQAYLQIDFKGPLRVIGVATRRHKEHWDSFVTSYRVSHSMDSVRWSYADVTGEAVGDLR